MSSLVSEFIINPVLRQARRFSEISRSTFGGDGEVQEHAATITETDVISDSEFTDELVPGPIEVIESSHIRPLSASTQETRVEEPATPPRQIEVAHPEHDHLGFPISPPRARGPIPEDDGMGSLRGRIQDINSRIISSNEKARLMHDLLSEGYRTSRKVVGPPELLASDASPPLIWRQSSPGGPTEGLKFWKNPLGTQVEPETFVLNETDILPTYAPIRQPKSPSNEATAPSAPPTPPTSEPPLGCQHYERNVKIECSTCKKWYPCVFCHDEKEDHNLIRKETKHMLCMICATPQKAGDTCVNCGETAARYYCDVCKLWENRATKPIYHCDDCGICRRGLGLGKDFFHCKVSEPWCTFFLHRKANSNRRVEHVSPHRSKALTNALSGQQIATAQYVGSICLRLRSQLSS